MRALITGINGFVGPYLQHQLKAEGAEVYGTTRRQSSCKEIYQLNLKNQDHILRLLNKIKPTHIFHLAGLSNVKESWSNISETLETNTIGTINVLEAVKKYKNHVRVLTIGSSEEYGKISDGIYKTCEKTPLNPLSPYGTSKAAVSMITQNYHKGYGVDVIHIRPFNHIGAGQKKGFVTADFAYQVAMIAKEQTDSNKITVGNLASFRDFTDVRDIVRAYHLLALKGFSGEIYNVCSGMAVKIEELLNTFISFSSKEITINVDPEKLRPSEVPHLVGDCTKLTELTGWEPAIPIVNSLQDIYQDWIDQL
ncbi:GDP-mannose 4,6-dehydratase [Metabacillus sp. 113a]|uniref:GDP-mannose 4,6-dehydratase n=1 Tax=Metabacillus sp. 113a TaxID=3404706 RepID=UPI003CF45A90